MYMHIVYIQYTLCEVLNEVPTENFPISFYLLLYTAVMKNVYENLRRTVLRMRPPSHTLWSFVTFSMTIQQQPTTRKRIVKNFHVNTRIC